MHGPHSKVTKASETNAGVDISSDSSNAGEEVLLLLISRFTNEAGDSPSSGKDGILTPTALRPLTMVARDVCHLGQVNRALRSHVKVLWSALSTIANPPLPDPPQGTTWEEVLAMASEDSHGPPGAAGEAVHEQSVAKGGGKQLTLDASASHGRDKDAVNEPASPTQHASQSKPQQPAGPAAPEKAAAHHSSQGQGQAAAVKEESTTGNSAESSVLERNLDTTDAAAATSSKPAPATSHNTDNAALPPHAAKGGGSTAAAATAEPAVADETGASGVQAPKRRGRRGGSGLYKLNMEQIRQLLEAFDEPRTLMFSNKDGLVERAVKAVPPAPSFIPPALAVEVGRQKRRTISATQAKKLYHLKDEHLKELQEVPSKPEGYTTRTLTHLYRLLDVIAAANVHHTHPRAEALEKQ